MFDYIGWSEVAELIRRAVRNAISSKHVTEDFATSGDETVLGTKQFGDYLAQNI